MLNCIINVRMCVFVSANLSEAMIILLLFRVPIVSRPWPDEYNNNLPGRNIVMVTHDHPFST